MINAVFELSDNLPKRGRVFWSIYALGLRNEKVWERLQELNRGLIDYCALEIELAEKAGVVKVDNKKEVATIIFAVLEGYGYFRSTLPDNPYTAQITQTMKKNIYDLLGLDERH